MAQEVTGRIYLTKINFSEETVILGVDLDFKQDIQYIDENSLEFLFPSQKCKRMYCFADYLGNISYFLKVTLSNIGIRAIRL